MERNNWSHEELIIAFNLYCRLGFTKIKYTHPLIVETSQLLGRTPSAVAFKLVNFARLDPDLMARGIKGMGHGSKGEELIWQEYNQNREHFIYKSEELIAERKNKNLIEEYMVKFPELSTYSSEDKFREVKVRACQDVFRSMILSVYNQRCAITGINLTSLLVASHIIPWAENKNERLNPENGLCLSATWDAAYDKGIIGVSPEYRVVFSRKLKEKFNESYFDHYFRPYENAKISIPTRFKPRREFLDYHLNNIFEKQDNF